MKHVYLLIFLIFSVNCINFLEELKDDILPEDMQKVFKLISDSVKQNKDLKCSRSHSNYDDYENSSVPAKNDNESSFLDVKNKSLNNVEKDDVENDGFGDNMNKEQYIDFYDTSKYADVTNDSNKLDHDLTNKLK